MTSNVFLQKPWESLLPRRRAQYWRSFDSVLGAFRHAVGTQADNIAIRYFDTLIPYRDLDRLSDGFARWLQARGVKKGDRVCLAMQNVPQFIIAVVGIWKTGAIPAPTNPMFRERELRSVFDDCRPVAVVCHPECVEAVGSALRSAGLGAEIVTASALDFQKRNDARVLPAQPADRADDFVRALAAPVSPKREFEDPRLTRQDIALLMYTSGTTGVPKGVMLTHGNLLANAQASADWIDLSESSRILGIAPLFHITGFVLHVCLAIVTRASVILTYRFDPHVVLDALLEHRPTFSVGAITAFLALMNAEESSEKHFESLTTIYSGGGPIPPAVVEQFEAKFKVSIRGSYGMTELTSPCHYTPLGLKTPVDPISGAFSIGIPIFNTEAMIVDDAGNPVGIGEAGELLIRGPQMMVGYWNKPAETAETLRGEWLHTGDVGLMDAAGWFYLVDRKKDVIIASGFKVWPREVEDVLYTHPAVREAAVIGVAHAYRGETPKACISLKPNIQTVSDDELKQFCRERMASYKVPHIFETLPELPKTVSGKIMRAELRRQAALRGER